MEKSRVYIAIDLKSFYASAECVARGLDPLVTNLVVADSSRTEKTICLAITAPLKKYGLPGRARLFEVVQKVNEINNERKKKVNFFTGVSSNEDELKDPHLALGYIVARPRMREYMRISTQIYSIYLKYVSSEDIHVYSIDEVFIDATDYLKMYSLTARDFAMKLILDVFKTTGITATAGIAPNLYLSKVALDILAKHVEADKNGVRIAELDERSYREKLWSHRPLTDFWRVGRGYAKKLEDNGLYTMGDIARCSVGSMHSRYNEDLLYKLFGINAELLIDHAWGYEPCRICDIKAYRPSRNSLSSGQVLSRPYPNEKAALIVWEMARSLTLSLVEKQLVTDRIELYIGYDIENINKSYDGKTEKDRYGRKVPKEAHGYINLGRFTSSEKIITESMQTIFSNISDKNLSVRRVTVVAANVIREDNMEKSNAKQLDFFTDEKEEAEKERELEREKNRQRAVISIMNKYGKNAILKGRNLEQGATAKERNDSVGGHKA